MRLGITGEETSFKTESGWVGPTGRRTVRRRIYQGGLV